MNYTSYLSENDICITAMGCVLPGSPNTTSFWKNLLSGQDQIVPIPETKFNVDTFYSPNTPMLDKMCTRQAGVISEEIIAQIVKDLGINPKYNYTHLLSLAAFKEAYQMLNSSHLSERKCDFIFSLINSDTEYTSFYLEEKNLIAEINSLPLENPFKEKIISKVQEHIQQFLRRRTTETSSLEAVYPISFIDNIKNKYNLKGEKTLINAACAGALAALDLAVLRLQNNEADLVFTGGIHSSLTPGLFIAFSEMGILAPNKCLPFDAKSLGTSLGEGAVVFSLQKVGSALADGNQILAVIKGIGYSNNGSNTGLFSLNSEQLLKAYQMAYAHLEHKQIDYLEAHATGTVSGDRAELKSISKFWNHIPINTGSVKAIVGHTQGAAGAVGLLKSLLIIKNKIIPPSPYFNQIVGREEHNNITINTDPIKLEKNENLRIGISAFGLGGTNFHMVIEEVKDPKLLLISDGEKFHSASHQTINASIHTNPDSRLVVLSNIDLKIEEIKKFDFVNNFKISPKLFEYIDPLQIYALLPIDLAIKEVGPLFNYLDKERIGVIYAGIIKSYIERETRLKIVRIIHLLKDESPILINKLMSIRDQYPISTAETGAGTLDSVIAGRICQKYDFTGKSYQVDSEKNSLLHAVKMAELEIKRGLDLIMLVHQIKDEKILDTPWNDVRLETTGFMALILSSSEFAKKHGLKIKYTIEDNNSFNINSITNNNQLKAPSNQEIKLSANPGPKLALGKELKLAPYKGPNFSNLAFIFPGQNAAAPKMFENIYSNYKFIKSYFEQANTYSKEKYGLVNISNFITNPTQLAATDLNAIKNPALFTMQVALAEYLIKKDVTPQILAAHSFGVYAQLVVAGVYSFEDMLDLVLFRDSILPAAYSLGTLLLVTKMEVVKKVLSPEEYYICNENSPEQTAIAIPPASFEQVIKKLRDNQIFYHILKEVKHPFHSPLLKEVNEKIKTYIYKKNYNISIPKIPLYSFVDNEIINRTNGDESGYKDSITKIITDNTTAPVNFIKVINDLYKQGTASFVEIGPRKFCSNFINSILNTAEHSILPLDSFFSHQNTPLMKYQLTNENSKVFEVVRQIIHKVTGHNLDNISIQDRYQDDLNIDSIKKAEIFFNTAKEFNIDEDEDFYSSNFSSIGETVEFIQAWCANLIGGKKLRASNYKPEYHRYKLSWKLCPQILVSDSERSSSNITVSSIVVISLSKDPLLIADKLCTTIRTKESSQGKPTYTSTSPNSSVSPKVIILDGTTLDKEFNLDNFIFSYENVLFKIITAFKMILSNLNEISELNRSPNKFSTISTIPIHIAIIYNNEYHPLIQGLISFFATISRETNNIFVKSILLSTTHQRTNSKPLYGLEKNPELFKLITNEIIYPLNRDVAYINHKRMIRTLIKCQDHQDISLTERNNLVALGGHHGITLHLLKNINIYKNTHLYLVGRSNHNDPEVKSAIYELSTKYAQVKYISGDCTQLETFNKITSSLSKIDLLINGVGIEYSLLLKDKSIPEIKTELDTKVLTLINILKISEVITISNFINFSSLAALYGNVGQAVYSAASAISATLAHQLKRISPVTNFQNIYWPAWDHMGMTAKEGISAKLLEQGISLLGPDKGVSFFNKELIIHSAREQEITLLDHYDKGAYQLNVHLLSHFVKLLGIKERQNLYEFKKTFDLQNDAYLKGHLISNTSMVGLAPVATMMLAHYYLQTGTLPTIKNLVINQTIKLEDNLELRFLCKKGQRGLKYLIKQGTNVSFSALLSSPSSIHTAESAMPLLDWKLRNNLPNKKVLDQKAIYELLPHQGVFRCLNRLEVKESEQMVAYIDQPLSLSPIHHLGIFDQLILLIDAMLQANGLFIPLIFNQESLPAEIELLKFHPLFNKIIFAGKKISTPLVIFNKYTSPVKDGFRSELHLGINDLHLNNPRPNIKDANEQELLITMQVRFKTV